VRGFTLGVILASHCAAKALSVPVAIGTSIFSPLSSLPRCSVRALRTPSNVLLYMYLPRRLPFTQPILTWAHQRPSVR